MFSNQAARASVDSLPPLSPPHSRSEFPFHRYAPAVRTCPMPTSSLTAARQTKFRRVPSSGETRFRHKFHTLHALDPFDRGALGHLE